MRGWGRLGALACVAVTAAAAQAAGAVTAGTVDPSWGGAPGGVLVESLHAVSDWATNVAVQPDGRILVLSTTTDGGTSNVVVSRYTTAGALDPTFGGTGRVTVSTPAGAPDGEALLVRPDGRIIVVTGNPGGVIQMGVAQLTPTGGPDPTFNGGATLYLNPELTPPFSLTEESARDAVLLSDGKLVVGGQARFNDGGAENHLVGIVVGVTPTGTQDGFNTFVPALDRNATVTAMDRYPDDRIVLVGVHQQGSTAFNLDLPSRDSWVHEISGQTLASSGSFRTLDLSGVADNDFVNDVAADATGAVLVGWARNGAALQGFAARIGRGPSVAPALDTGFGVGGKRVVTTSANDHLLTNVKRDLTGRFVAEGLNVRAPAYRPIAARILPGGALDPSFGTGGVVAGPDVDNVLISNFRWAGMDIAPDGRIVVGTHRVGTSIDQATFRRFGDLSDLAPTASMPSTLRLNALSTASVHVANAGDPSGPVTVDIGFSRATAASVTTPGGSCINSGTTNVRCTLPALPTGVATDVSLTLRPLAVGPLTVTVTTSPTVVDGNPVNDTVVTAPVNVERSFAVLALWRTTAKGRKLTCGVKAASPCAVSRAVRLRLAGTSLPKRPLGDRTVRIGVFRKVGLRWVRTRLIAVRATSAGAYKLSLAPLPAGSYRIRATTKATATITAGTSAWRYVRVR